MLGTIYYDGEIVEANKAESVKWYKLAAENGNALAQYYLSQYYAEGVGVDKDAIASHIWLNLAVSAGVSFAHEDLFRLEEKMSKKQIIIAQDLAVACKENGFKDCGIVKNVMTQ